VKMAGVAFEESKNCPRKRRAGNSGTSEAQPGASRRGRTRAEASAARRPSSTSCGIVELGEGRTRERDASVRVSKNIPNTVFTPPPFLIVGGAGFKSVKRASRIA